MRVIENAIGRQAGGVVQTLTMGWAMIHKLSKV